MPNKTTVNKVTIFVGLNDKDTKKQLVSTDAAEDYIADVVADKIGFGTIYRAKGVYKHADGHTVKENTIVIVLCDVDRALALEIAGIFGKKFNQESIGFEVQETEFNLIEKGDF